MPNRGSFAFDVPTAGIAVDARTSGFLVDPAGRIALICRGRGVAASPSADQAVELIRGLLSILPDLEDRDQALADQVAARLEILAAARRKPSAPSGADG